MRDQIRHIYRKIAWILPLQWDHNKGNQHIRLLYTIFSSNVDALDDHIRADIVPI